MKTVKMERRNYREAEDRNTCCNTCCRMRGLRTDGWAVCQDSKGWAKPVFKYDVCDEYSQVRPKC